MKRLKNAQALIEHVLTYKPFQPVPDKKGVVPIPTTLTTTKGAKLVLVVGENASGKSMVRRVVHHACDQAKTECIHISAEGRSAGYNIMRSFVYGDEGRESSGVCSARTVLTGIATCKSRETPHVMFWDEPDLGLSENGAAGAGVAIRKFVEELGPLTTAVFVVTHSKALVRQLMTTPHHFLFVGLPSMSLAVWLNAPVVPRDLEELRETGHKRFRLIRVSLGHKKPP